MSNQDQQHDHEPTAGSPQCVADIYPSSPSVAASPGSVPTAKLPFPQDVVNPFVNDIDAHSTAPQRIKMILLGLTLAPIRFVTLILCMLVAWGFAKLAVMGYSEEELQKYPMKDGICKKATYLFARVCMFCLGYQWLEADESNWCRWPDGSIKRANVVVINHSTICDGFLLYYLHSLMSIGVSSVADAPLFGAMAKAGQAFSLNRDDPNCKKRISDELNRRARWTDDQVRTLGQWKPFVVFAEGTCTNQKALIQFRHGAFQPGVPVQPMIVRYPYRYCDQSWCGLSNPLASVIRLLCQFHNRLQYEYLPVYVPNAEEQQDPALFAHNVRNVMAAAMRVPTTEHTFEDMKLSAVGRNLGLPWRSIHCEMGYFRRHGSTYEKAKAALKQFAEIDSNKDGVISNDELKRYMKTESWPSSVTQVMYDQWCNSRGPIQFRHFYFVTGLRSVEHRGEVVLLDRSDSDVLNSAHSKLFARLCGNEASTRDSATAIKLAKVQFIETLRRCTGFGVSEGEHRQLEAVFAQNAAQSERSDSNLWSEGDFVRFLNDHPLLLEYFLFAL